MRFFFTIFSTSRLLRSIFRRKLTTRKKLFPLSLKLLMKDNVTIVVCASNPPMNQRKIAPFQWKTCVVSVSTVECEILSMWTLHTTWNSEIRREMRYSYLVSRTETFCVFIHDSLYHIGRTSTCAALSMNESCLWSTFWEREKNEFSGFAMKREWKCLKIESKITELRWEDAQHRNSKTWTCAPKSYPRWWESIGRYAGNLFATWRERERERDDVTWCGMMSRGVR